MKIDAFLNQLTTSPESIVFEDTMAVVENNYTFTPTRFENGKTINEAGENSGSCKLFALAKELKLTEKQTLLAFGQYYRDVLATPEGTDHQNIRNFMEFGWNGILFSSIALQKK